MGLILVHKVQTIGLTWARGAVPFKESEKK